MRDLKDWIWLGLALGAIWAFRGIEGAGLALGLAAVGLLIGLVIRAPGGIRSLLERDDDSL